MKVSNMISSKGHKIANQFIVEGATFQPDHRRIMGKMFQSFDSNIAFISKHVHGLPCNIVWLDRFYWDYSVTTGKYRNQFLNETKKETQAKIDSGTYILTNLNG